MDVTYDNLTAVICLMDNSVLQKIPLVTNFSSSVSLPEAVAAAAEATLSFLSWKISPEEVQEETERSRRFHMLLLLLNNEVVLVVRFDSERGNRTPTLLRPMNNSRRRAPTMAEERYGKATGAANKLE